LGGFCQGATLALATFLLYKGSRPLGGLFSMSGFNLLSAQHLNINED